MLGLSFSCYSVGSGLGLISVAQPEPKLGLGLGPRNPQKARPDNKHTFSGATAAVVRPREVARTAAATWRPNTCIQRMAQLAAVPKACSSLRRRRGAQRTKTAPEVLSLATVASKFRCSYCYSCCRRRCCCSSCPVTVERLARRQLWWRRRPRWRP